MKRLRFTVLGAVNGVWGEDADGGDDDLPCVRVADFDRTTLAVRDPVPTYRKISKAERRRRVLTRGDLLLEKSGGGELQPVGAVVLYDRDESAVCSNFVARLEVAPGHSARFLSYLHASLYTGRINQRSIKQTTGIQNLDASTYLDERVSIPPCDEQATIAAVLDRETTRLDALIDKRRRMIELLQEKRAALITYAVTRGLDPDVPLKESGVEWLGRIPAHWDVRRVKLIAKLESGHTPSKQVAAYWEDCDVQWVSLNDSKQLASSDYITETAVQINSLGLANSSARLLPAGAVVFTRDATIGLAAITTCPMAVSQHLIAWIPGPQVVALYLLRVFNAMKPALDAFTFGATIKTIGMPDVKKLAAPLPPLAEQAAINEHIERESAKVEALEQRVRRSVLVLAEHRASLIIAAVTGQIDVRARESVDLPVPLTEAA